jgi:replicative DNA helicase
MSETTTRTPEERYPAFEPLPATVEKVIDIIGARTGKPDILTGFRVVDEGLWGLHRGQLLTIAARPGQGKTSLACQIAYNVAKNGYKTAFLSLEMTKHSILERMFCAEYDVKAWDLLTGNISKEITEKLSRFLVDCRDIPLQIIDDYCFTERELFTLIEHIQFRPDVIFLDHIQHIRSSSKKSNYECLTEYFRYMKELSMRYNMAVVVLSQINRSGEEKPTLANLKGTGGIEEMSDYVFLMNPSEGLKVDEFGKNYSIVIAKNRFGAVKVVDMYFDPKMTKFSEVCADAIKPFSVPTSTGGLYVE